MPIKIPKGFTRRKSSGNALEDAENAPQPSFKVLERPSADRKSFSDVNLLSKRLSDGQVFDSSPEETDNIFSASSRTRKSYTGLQGHASSNHFNLGSTRSTTEPAPVDTQTPHSRNLHEIPIPPLSGALRAAGRTFSFGGRFSKNSTSLAQQPTSSNTRTMTNSSTSTATPPKLLDPDLQIGRIDDDFNNMFDEFGYRRDKSASLSQSSTNQLTQSEDRVLRPEPINIDRSSEVEPSPYSWDSKYSEEGLLAASHSPHTPELNLGEPRKSFSLSHTMPTSTNSHRTLENPAGTKSLSRGVLSSDTRDSRAVEDEDSRLILESLYGSKRDSQIPFASNQDDSDIENDRLLANEQSLPICVQPAENPDSSIAAHARLAAQYEKSQPASSLSNKVMTPSQFEHYRQQQELRRSNSDATKSDDSSDIEFDEEDEMEKNREAEKQRRKQEAHLSVYRQQMMKVTGQQSRAPPLRPELDRASNSAPNLAMHSSHTGSKSGGRRSSEGEGDDDDEIPLGILAAHGFPNRNRPPSRLAPSNSNPNLRASFHHQPYLSSGASAVEQEVGNRSSLPVFARNLPRDPYFGASLVNHSNRESLALGGGSPIHNAPTAAAPPSSLPPGGLVGVIATEERARAMRRGSPNMQAMYEYQAVNHGGIPRPYTMMNMNTPNMPIPQQGVSATEQAQIQLSHQMTSMMQMQMQWMQQMMQMQGGQVPMMSPGGYTPIPTNQNMRPSSMPSAGPFYSPDQRTLGMLDPNASFKLNNPAGPFTTGASRPGTPGQGYTPSIAPSERSNVGLAPRYRPISTGQQETSLIQKSWNDENLSSSLPVVSPESRTIRPLSSTGRSAIVPQPEDEDDEEGWAEMTKKREKKRNNWKIKKETSNISDLVNAVH